MLCPPAKILMRPWSPEIATVRVWFDGRIDVANIYWRGAARGFADWVR